jgi:beta-mannanase
MDENLKNAKIMKDDYSTTKLEMMARSFETFVDIKLDEKGIKNLISNASGNNYAPDKIEMKHYLSEWENVVSDIRGLFNDICPVKKMKDNFDISKISANINIIRDSALSETTQNNKIKIG